MLDFDETKTYPKQKPMEWPSVPPQWIEEPQIPPWILAAGERSYNPDQPRDSHGRWGSGGGSALLEDQLHEKYPHTSFNFTGVGPGIAKKVGKQIDTLFTDFPDVAKSVGYVGTGVGMPNAPVWKEGNIAVTRDDYPQRGLSSIFLNPGVFGDVEKSEDLFERAEKMGWFAGDYTLESMVSHEFGHSVDFYLGKATHKSILGFMGPGGEGTIEASIDEFKMENEESGNKVSGYSKRGGPTEAWAEAFSSHYHGGRQSSYAKAQAALLKQIFPASKWRDVTPSKLTSNQSAEWNQFGDKYLYMNE